MVIINYLHYNIDIIKNKSTAEMGSCWLVNCFCFLSFVFVSYAITILFIYRKTGKLTPFSCEFIEIGLNYDVFIFGICMTQN